MTGTSSVLTPAQIWLSEIDYALNRERLFRKNGKNLLRIFEASSEESVPFNILYSNVDTLQPALYNSIPRPVVQRRYKDADPVGKEAARLAQRILEFQIAQEPPEYPTFDEMMQSSVLQALVPGRGITQFKYEASFEEREAAESEETAGASPEEFDEVEASETATGSSASPHTFNEVVGEAVCLEDTPWDSMVHGFARNWKDVPWVAFRYPMTKEELRRNFGDEKTAQISLEETDDTVDDGEASGANAQEKKETKQRLPTTTVWKIWDKSSKKVLFVSDCYIDGFLKELEDPLGLANFYPFPKPLTFARKISSLVPVALYEYYREQAEELNEVTIRIRRLTKAMKIRGGYDANIQEVEKILVSDDNSMTPLQNIAALGDSRGLDKAIWLVPIEKFLSVLQQLLIHRQQIKQIIYEITGISDILRGASVASETATAQNIKNQWGTLRLKRMQKEVARYVCDCLRIQLELAVKHLSIDTLRQMTGLPYPTAKEKAQAQAVLEQVQMAAVQGMPAQQSPELGQMQQLLSMPSWEELLDVLRSDLHRAYKVDVQTNSTVDAEATEDKNNIAEFLNALSQFFNALTPAIQGGYMSFPAAKEMLLSIVRRFRFGEEVEEQINSMAPPPAAGADPAQEAKAESAKQDLELRKQEAEFRRWELKQEKELKQQEFALKQQELAQKMQLAEMRFRADMEAAKFAAVAKATAPAGGDSQGAAEQ